MILLDLFCGAGGCSVGYHRAGFEVVGVDIEPQKNYPFEFYQADAFEFVIRYGNDFDVIHASPPCQKFSQLNRLHKKEYLDLISPTRNELKSIDKPYIIENVPGAPLVNPIILCGTMFNLRVIRHRHFETSPNIWMAPASCNHWGRLPQKGIYGIHENGFSFLTVTGNNFKAEQAGAAMGIDWMTRDELSQAIPPAYTEWLGKRIIEVLREEVLG